MTNKELFILELNKDEEEKVKAFLQNELIHIFGRKDFSFEGKIFEELSKMKEEYNTQTLTQKKILGDIVFYGTPLEELAQNTNLIYSKQFDNNHYEYMEIKYDSEIEESIFREAIFQSSHYDITKAPLRDIVYYFGNQALLLDLDILETEVEYKISNQKTLNKYKTIFLSGNKL